MTMTFNKSIMAQVCLLVAVFTLSSVIGREIVNLRENKDTDSSMGENVKYQRRQAATTTPQTSNFTCGLRPAIRSKRNDEDEDAFVDGSYARHSEVPWQVNIYESGYHICGGAIINEYWVISSAKCLSVENNSELTVVVGDYNSTATDPGEETFQTARVKVHAQFNRSASNIDYNIGLLKIRGNASSGGPIRGFRFGDYVQPVCLPTASEVLLQGDELTISEWKKEENSEEEPEERLKISTIRIRSELECSHLNMSQLSTCAWDSNATSRVCLGDDGGPATFQFGGRGVLGAIVYSKDYCFSPRAPLILTRVVNFVDWIRDVIKDNSSRDESVMPSRPASN